MINNNNFFQINLSTNFLFFLILIFTLYAGYFNSSLPAYFLIFLIIIINLFRIKFTSSQLLVILFFIIYSTVILIFSISPLSSLMNLKWYYGIVIYLILFKIENARLFFFSYLSSNKVFFVYLLSVIFESILINFIFDPQQFYGDRSTSSTLGNYNRPLGPAGNSSVTATFIIAWYYSLNLEVKKYQKYIFFTYSIAILILMSGTGLIIYLVGLLVSKFKLLKNNKLSFLIIYLFFFAILSLIYYFLLSENYIQKVSLIYYLNVLENKFLTISENYNSFFYNYIFGYSIISEQPITGSDFGWYSLIFCNGILGFIIFILIIIAFGKDFKKNRVSFFILFLGAFHYAIIFLTPGQILITKLIAKKNE